MKAYATAPISPGHGLHRATVPPAAIPPGKDDLRAALTGLVTSGHQSLVGIASIYVSWEISDTAMAKRIGTALVPKDDLNFLFHKKSQME